MSASRSSGGRTTRTGSASGTQIGSGGPITDSTAWGTSSASPTGASGTNQTPSGIWSASRAAASMARRVFPVPPGPVRMTSRPSPSNLLTRFSSSSRPTKLVSWAGRVSAGAGPAGTGSAGAGPAGTRSAGAGPAGTGSAGADAGADNAGADVA